MGKEGGGVKNKKIKKDGRDKENEKRKGNSKLK